jgi:hypothetical protein
MKQRFVATTALLIAVTSFSRPAAAGFLEDYTAEDSPTSEDLHYLGVAVDYPNIADIRLLTKGDWATTSLSVAATTVRGSLDGNTAYGFVDGFVNFRLVSIHRDHQLGLGINYGIFAVPKPDATSTTALNGALVVGPQLGYGYSGIKGLNLMAYFAVSGLISLGAVDPGKSKDNGARISLDFLGTYKLNSWLNAFGGISLAEYALKGHSVFQPNLFVGVGYDW